MKIELTHDILAAKIYDRVSSDEKTLRKVEKFIGDRYQFYEARHVLLGKDDIDYINPYLKNVDISKEEDIFIKRSKSALQRKRRLLMALAALIFLLISGSAIIAWIQRHQAIENKERAEEQTLIAEREKEAADSARRVAIYESQRAQQAADSALAAQKREALQRQIAQEKERQAINARQNAVRAKIEADSARARAEQAKNEEEAQRLIAEAEKKRAEANEREANRLLILSIAQSMATKSLQIEHEQRDLKCLVAQQAFKFNKKAEGPNHDRAVYSGLYYALKILTTDSLNNLYGHTSSVRSVTFAKDGTMFTTGSDGKYLGWKDWLTKERTRSPIAQPWLGDIEPNSFMNQPQVNRPLMASPDRNWLAGGDDNGNLRLFNLRKNSDVSHVSMVADTIIPLGQGRIWDLIFDPWKAAIYFSHHHHLLQYDIVLKKLDTLFTASSTIKSLAITRNAQKLAATSEDGSIYFWEKNGQTLSRIPLDASNNKKDFMQVAFNYDASLLAIGDLEGKVYLVDLDIKETKHILTGHTARISSLAFNLDSKNKYLASSSYDGTIQLWHLNDSSFQALPLVLDDHQRGNYVTSISFVPDQPFVVAGCYTGLIKLWPTDQELLSEVLCEYMNEKSLRNNFTDQEWQQYVGKNDEKTKIEELEKKPVCDQ